MLKFTITVKGRTESDVREAIIEALRLIDDGFVTGSDRNSTGSYAFEGTGECGEYLVITDGGDTLYLTKGEVTAMVNAFNEQGGEDAIELADALDGESDENGARQKACDWAVANKPELLETI